MSSKYLWRGVLAMALSVALATPARADRLQTTADRVIIGVVAVTAAVAVLVTVLILHHKSKTTVTGCVNSGGGGMTVTDEKDKQVYALSGNTAGIKPGDRMKLQGKKVKPEGPDKKLVFEAKEMTKDFGLCQP